MNLARGWAISGISDQTREAAMTAADAAGMPVGMWVEQALRQALEAKAEPAQPEGVGIDELEAMVRRVVAEELRPVKEALAHVGTTAPPSAPAARSPGEPHARTASAAPRAVRRLAWNRLGRTVPANSVGAWTGYMKVSVVGRAPCGPTDGAYGRTAVALRPVRPRGLSRCRMSPCRGPARRP